MDETQEKSVIKNDSKEKIGNTINQLDLPHRLFINHGDYGGSARTPLISVRLSQRLGGLPALTSQSAWRLSITTSRWVSSSKRSRKSSSSSG
jgi:hypothetical protein